MSFEMPLVMTVEEVAQYLRIPQSSVYRLAQRGRIPCQKAGRRWRFHREAIDHWLGNRGSAGDMPSSAKAE